MRLVDGPIGVLLVVGLLLGVTTTATAGLVPGPPSHVRTGEQAPSDAAGEETGRLVLVLDSSGSMAERAAGTTKIEAARTALREVVAELPDTAEVGMRVFGATVFSRDEAGACRDSQNVVPVGPLDRDALESAVRDYEPYGETPVGYALQQAAKDLGPARDGEPRTIVLLSDGEPNCQPDPCKVAADLAKQGIDLTINVVGLDVSGKARRALQCIAEAGNGDYYDASSAEDLSNSMVKVSVRPMRGFSLGGERITGGTTTDQPLPVEPGTYVDTSLPDEQLRYYLVRPPKGGGVAASTLVRPPKGEENWSTVARLKILTVDGEECANSYDLSFQIIGFTPLTATGVEYQDFSRSYNEEECAAAEEFLVGVSLDAEPSDYLLRITTFPKLLNPGLLPPELEDDEGPWVARVSIPGSGTRTPVVGGVHFGDAPLLEPDTTYEDTLRPSEQLVYRVNADYGQAVRVSARVGTDRLAADRLGAQGNPVRLSAHTSLWERMSFPFQDGVSGSEFYNGDEPTVVTAVVPPLRLANAGSSKGALRGATRGGDQYFVLGMGALDADTDFAAPVAIRAELVGEPDGVPEYADEVDGLGLSSTTTPTESPSPKAEESATPEEDQERAAATEDSGTGSWWLWVVGVLLALVLLAGGFLLGRRKA